MASSIIRSKLSIKSARFVHKHCLFKAPEYESWRIKELNGAMTKSISISRFSTLIFTAATHVLIFISMGDVWNQELLMAAAYFFGFALLGAWASGPYVLAHWRAAAFFNWRWVWAFPALSAVSAAFAFGVYYDAMFFEPLDARVAIVFAIVPAYQYILILAATGAASWLRRSSE